MNFGDLSSELGLEVSKSGILRKVVEAVEGGLSGGFEVVDTMFGGSGEVVYDGEGRLEGGEGFTGGIGGEVSGLENGA